jgi:hypothetical protein
MNQTQSSNKIRRCSCCGSQTHNIKLCNDQILVTFEENLFNKKSILLEIVSIQLNDKISYFTIWIKKQPTKLIKNYALRFCGANSKNNLQTCIELVINYIWDISNSEQINLNEINSDDDNSFIQNSYNYLELELSDFLARLRNEYKQMNESRKFDIAILNNKAQIKDNFTEECNICYEPIKETDMIKLNCNHQFCKNCIKQTLKKCSPNCDPCCAMCRSKIICMTINDNKIINDLKHNLISTNII